MPTLRHDLLHVLAIIDRGDCRLFTESKLLGIVRAPSFTLKIAVKEGVSSSGKWSSAAPEVVLSLGLVRFGLAVRGLKPLP